MKDTEDNEEIIQWSVYELIKYLNDEKTVLSKKKIRIICCFMSVMAKFSVFTLRFSGRDECVSL